MMGHQVYALEPRTNSTTSAKSSPDSHASSIIAINGILTGIALLVVLLRIYVRAAVLRALGSDDWVILGATVCSITVLICFIFETKTGIGLHVQEVTLPMLQHLLHWQFYHSIVVMVGVSLVKISIGLFLLRFVTGKGYKRVVWGMIAFLIVFTLVCAGTLIFACLPVAASWNFALKATAKCYSTQTFTDIGLFNSSINIFTDVAFALLPVPVIWKLQINKRTKITLTIILSLGFFACAAAIYKTYLQSRFYATPDYTRNDSFFVWNSIEFHIGILAASLPTLRPLFASCIESTKTMIKGRSTNRSGERKSGYGQKSAISLGSIPSNRNDNMFNKGRATTTETQCKFEADNDDGSEENILPMHAVPMHPPPQGIAVRKEYAVAWEQV